MEHRGSVHSGAVCARAASGRRRQDERMRGGQAVRASSRDRAEDAAVSGRHEPLSPLQLRQLHAHLHAAAHRHASGRVSRLAQAGPVRLQGRKGYSDSRADGLQDRSRRNCARLCRNRSPASASKRPTSSTSARRTAIAEALRPLVKGDSILVEGELRTSTYDKELPVVGGGTTIVPTKVWEIRARAVRKLARKKKPAAKAAKALKAAA